MWAITIHVQGKERPVGFPFLDEASTPLMYEKMEDADKACELIARGYAERAKFSGITTRNDIRVNAKIMEEPEYGTCEINYAVIAGDFVKQGYYTQALKTESRKVRSPR